MSGALRRALVVALTLWTSLLVPRLAHAQAADDATLVVGLTGKYPPFHYFDEGGELVGFDVDFAKEVCAHVGRTCRFQPIEWDGLVGALLADKIDVVIGSMAITPEREKAVRFSVPYYESGARLFVRPGAPAPETPGFAIGVTLGTTFEQATRERFPSAEVRVFKGDTDVLQDLIAGRLDAMVTDDLVGAYLARKRGAIVKPAGERLFEERMGIPMKPGREALLAEIDAAVGAIRASGKQRALLDAHLGAGAAAASGSVWTKAIPMLLEGLLATVWISGSGLLLGVFLSLALAWAMLSRSFLARPVALLVDFVRATPFVIQLFALYFGPPSLGLQVDARTSAVVAIAIHSAAYLAEVVKTAYRAVPDGQRLAARALGLSPIESLRYVVGPQMLPIAVVPSLNTVVAMIKDSAVVSVIGVYELTLQAQRLISTTFEPIPFYGAACVLYFLVTFPLLMLGRRLETRWRERGLLHG